MHATGKRLFARVGTLSGHKHTNQRGNRRRIQLIQSTTVRRRTGRAFNPLSALVAECFHPAFNGRRCEAALRLLMVGFLAILRSERQRAGRKPQAEDRLFTAPSAPTTG